MYLFNLSRFHPVRLLFCLGAVAFLTNCQPADDEVQVEGQVFVVTSDGDNQRLGSVRVQIFDEKKIDVHLKERERELAEKRESLQEELAQLEELLERQEEAVAEAKAAYTRRDAEVRRQLNTFNQETEQKIGSLESQIEANNAFIAAKDILPPPPEGIPTREKAQELEKRRQEWLSMSREERLERAENLEEANVELEANIEELEAEQEQMLYKFGDELRDLDKKTQAAENAARETRETVQNLRAELERPLDQSDYLTDLPERLRELRTDAAGEFSLKLPANGRYVVFAEAQRRVDGEEKDYVWFVRSNPEPGFRILLSNHNLIASDASENVIDLSATVLEESET